jgi:hypothetical protein
VGQTNSTSITASYVITQSLDALSISNQATVQGRVLVVLVVALQKLFIYVVVGELVCEIEVFNALPQMMMVKK